MRNRVPAGIGVATAAGMTIDEDVIVQRPSAALEPVVVNDANMSAAILMPDGNSIRQTQPFHVCGRGGTVTSQYRFPDENLASGAGIAGAHGASGMSSVGGTVRVGELVPGGTIRHALKINLFGHRNCHYDRREATPGYRWPARSADGYAGDSASSCAYGGTVPALRIGSLVAARRELTPRSRGFPRPRPISATPPVAASPSSRRRRSR